MQRFRGDCLLSYAWRGGGRYLMLANVFAPWDAAGEGNRIRILEDRRNHHAIGNSGRGSKAGIAKGKRIQTIKQARTLLSGGRRPHQAASKTGLRTSTCTKSRTARCGSTGLFQLSRPL